MSCATERRCYKRGGLAIEFPIVGFGVKVFSNSHFLVAI